MAFHVVFTTAVLCLTALIFSCEANPKLEKTHVTEDCLACICEAVSECSPTTECTEDVCGIFGIRRSYWIDSGKPVASGSHRKDLDVYEKCALDPVCSRQSVVSYMDKYGRDCNDDGVIDCADYAAIHQLGPYACKNNLPEAYRIRFSTCQRSVEALSG